MHRTFGLMDLIMPSIFKRDTHQPHIVDMHTQYTHTWIINECWIADEVNSLHVGASKQAKCISSCCPLSLIHPLSPQMPCTANRQEGRELCELWKCKASAMGHLSTLPVDLYRPVESRLPWLKGCCTSRFIIGLFDVDTEWFDALPSILKRVTPTYLECVFWKSIKYVQNQNRFISFRLFVFVSTVYQSSLFAATIYTYRN